MDIAPKLADNGTLGLALQPMASANTDIFACAAKATTLRQNAPASLCLTEQARRGEKGLGEGRFGGGMQFGERGWENDVLYAPKYKRGIAFSNQDWGKSQTVCYTEIDPPLPRPPENKFQNSAAIKTIASE